MALDLTTAKQKLSIQLKQNRLLIFAGSGISVDSGLPTWDGLILSFIDIFERVAKAQGRGQASRYAKLIEAARSHVDREQIRVATVLKDEFSKLMKSASTVVKTEYRDWLTNIFSDKPPNSNHSLIVKTNYPYILTTNYDLLLEKAAELADFQDLRRNCFTFKDSDKIAARFLHKKPAIIHVHGTYGSIESDELIFTADDYRRLINKGYDSFSFCLRMLFFNYSCLFVGYGASDPHLEDTIEDLASLYLNEEENMPLCESYLVLRRDKVDEVLDKYKTKMRTNLVVIDDHSETTDLLKHLYSLSPRQPELDFGILPSESPNQEALNIEL